MRVWAWLANATMPVLAGRIDEAGGEVSFTYDDVYLNRDDAISLYEPELPLRQGRQAPLAGLTVAGCINDTWPDGWSRVVIERKLRDRGDAVGNLHPFTYPRESSSDRVGALDYTDDAEWSPRGSGGATLDDLQRLARTIEAGETIDPALRAAIDQATASGGMRPKAFVVDGYIAYIAKLSSRSDTRPVTNIEALAMDLAGRAGVAVAPSRLVSAAGRDVLLVERFDRTAEGGRLMVVSGATMLGLDPFLGARYASYPRLADALRSLSSAPGDARELFARIVFNVLIGNTDDHARNHAAIWNGATLRLAPAFDICPQQRSGGEASQAMDIGRNGFRAANLIGCIDRAAEYGVDRAEAVDIAHRQIDAIRSNWADATDRARLTAAQREALMGGSILNPSVFYGWPEP